ncbi:MAG TPA: F-box-like domain-containing protein [Myxococcota bacterium]|nr:F-box-like domain-containing protein [Myxococcota bacterium]
MNRIDHATPRLEQSLPGLQDSPTPTAQVLPQTPPDDFATGAAGRTSNDRQAVPPAPGTAAALRPAGQLTALPQEVLVQIMRDLDKDELTCVDAACKALHAAARQDLDLTAMQLVHQLQKQGQAQVMGQHGKLTLTQLLHWLQQQAEASDELQPSIKDNVLRYLPPLEASESALLRRALAFTRTALCASWKVIKAGEAKAEQSEGTDENFDDGAELSDAVLAVLHKAVANIIGPALEARSERYVAWQTLVGALEAAKEETFLFGALLWDWQGQDPHQLLHDAGQKSSWTVLVALLAADSLSEPPDQYDAVTLGRATRAILRHLDPALNLAGSEPSPHLGAVDETLRTEHHEHLAQILQARVLFAVPPEVYPPFERDLPSPLASPETLGEFISYEDARVLRDMLTSPTGRALVAAYETCAEMFGGECDTARAAARDFLSDLMTTRS